MTQECPYCGKPLPDPWSQCCGEVGHGVSKKATETPHPRDFEPYFSQWMLKLTADNIHSKADIALELAKLERTLREREEALRWVPVTERMPPEMAEVEAVTVHRTRVTTMGYEVRRPGITSFTHWRLITALPQPEKE